MIHRALDISITALVALALLACSGCAAGGGNGQAAYTAAMAENHKEDVAIGSISAYVEVGSQTLDSMQKYVMDAGKPYLANLQKLFIGIKTEAAKADAANDKEKQEIKAVKDYGDGWRKNYETEVTRFWSLRQRRLFWWAMGGLAVALILWGLGSFLPGIGVFSVVFKTIAHVLLGILTCGIHFIGLLFAHIHLVRQTQTK